MPWVTACRKLVTMELVDKTIVLSLTAVAELQEGGKK
eukprot:CAMPEP_0174356822 /NCGR_PEP_ID=MMETSP0811_2-20130205/32196_1 /TAXON_ID=73025 ORGANISM="Eutreptiella gymnastica-like, Strain CCMP1594" /NCGR_SAMPLE_ID=MMETSP0811_2 /ASSEMBLY_ACC=CAM_ASM_000667 /LENGTH=36 /DNA_ID= /DNA_START= /DNA_END= /DNA_ORIENTATION=